MAAPTSTLQVIRDGARNYVAKATFISAGLDQPLTTFVNAAAANPPFGSHGKIVHITYDVIPGGLVRLYWDVPLNPVDILDLGGFGERDFRRTGGIQNNGGSTATGNILINTQGFSLNYQYSIILEMVKGV